MLFGKKITCVIPARLESKRLPRKVLAYLVDKPLLEWVWRSALQVKCFDAVIFAVDAQITADLVSTFGASWVMTSSSCVSGTDRLVELALNGSVQSDIWVNWQGDEPFIQEQMVMDLLQGIADDICSIWTLRKKITDVQHIIAPNVAKVVCDKSGNALYFSRSPIPFYRDQQLEQGVFYKHVGIYAYTTQALKKIQTIPYGDLEDAEKLEQLRFLEHGLQIRAYETSYEVMGIDTIEDLKKAEDKILKENYFESTLIY